MNLIYRVLMVLAGIFFAFTSAYADEEADVPSNEFEVRMYRGGEPTAKLYLEKSITEKVALSLVAFTTRGWDEVTVGPVYYITPEMSVSLGLGVSRYVASNAEKKNSHRTLTAMLFLKNDKVESEITIEHYACDPKPWYYNIYAQTPITDNLSVGIFGEKAVGWGPRLSWAAYKNISFWVAPILNKDRDSDISVVAGIQIAF